MFPSLQLPSLTLLCVIPLLAGFTIFKQLRRSTDGPQIPPGPWKLPIIGNLHHLGILHHLLGRPNLYHITFTSLALKYRMPIMHLQLGKLSLVIISSPEIAEEVLWTKGDNFAQRFQLIDAESHPYPDCSLIFAPYNEYYLYIKKIANEELFSMKRVKSLKSVREEEVWSLVDTIGEKASSIPINISENFSLLINNIVTRSVLGNRSDYLLEFRSCLGDVVSSTKTFGVDAVFPFLKFLNFVSGKNRRQKKVFEQMHKVLSAIIDEHKTKKKAASASTSEDQPEVEDLLDVLLRIEGTSEGRLTHDHIKNLILDIFAAGSMAVRAILEWAMAEMLRNPRIMEKAQAEVRNAFPGKFKLKEEETQNLPYLKSVVKETLRLHTSTPLLPRESINTCEISGFLIPEKTKIMVNQWAMSRDPRFWSDWDPKSFEPERFTGRPPRNGTEYPFGAGKRNCPGKYFASTTIEFALAQLLLCFDWKLPQGVTPENLDMNEVFEITTRRKEDLYVVAVHV